MSRLLSTRVLFVAAALGFTGASALCATVQIPTKSPADSEMMSPGVPK
jgi:hypothetical protein